MQEKNGVIPRQRDRKQLLTVDGDFDRLGVGGGDVVESAALVVAGLVPRDARDVQVLAVVVLPGWKGRETRKQRVSHCVYK